MAQLVDRDETPHRLPLSLDTLIITSLRSGGYRPAGKGLSPRTRFKVTQMSRGEGCVKTSSPVMLNHLHCSPVVGCSIEKKKKNSR